MRNCPLCKNNNSSLFMASTKWNNRDGIELRKCKKCKFVYSKSSDFDYEIFARYADKNNEELNSIINQQGLNLLINEIVDKSKIKSGKVLDFGCGVGLSLLYFQQKGFSTFGIEDSKVFLEKHKQLNIISAKSLKFLDQEKNSFDLIIMKDVLEHVDNPIETLKEVVSYLKPCGYFYVRVPNVYHYDFHWSIDTKSHINHFSPKHLFHLFEQHNMRKIDFINLYDISTRAGKIYNFVFWKLRHFLPMYHQISLLYQKN